MWAAVLRPTNPPPSVRQRMRPRQIPPDQCRMRPRAPSPPLMPLPQQAKTQRPPMHPLKRRRSRTRARLPQTRRSPACPARHTRSTSAPNGYALTARSPKASVTPRATDIFFGLIPEKCAGARQMSMPAFLLHPNPSRRQRPMRQYRRSRRHATPADRIFPSCPRRSRLTHRQSTHRRRRSSCRTQAHHPSLISRRRCRVRKRLMPSCSSPMLNYWQTQLPTPRCPNPALIAAAKNRLRP